MKFLQTVEISRNLVYNAFVYRQCTGSCRQWQRARPRLKGAQGRQPTRGPAANPRRAFPLQNDESRARMRQARWYREAALRPCKGTGGFLGTNLQVCDAACVNSKGFK